MQTIAVQLGEQFSRVLVVGCPRSGTTLLQSLLAAHPELTTFPETHFFHRIQQDRDGRTVDAEAGSAAVAALAELVGPVVTPRPPTTVSDYAEVFVATLDAEASRRQRRGWVEKTPIHLRYVDDIDAHVPYARVVHLIRSGTAVVASLADVTRRYPDAWGGQRTVQQCLDRWLGDLRRSAACVGRPGHLFVSYEQLVLDPRAVLERLTGALELPKDADAVGSMLTHYPDAVDEVARTEPWKAGVVGDIVNVAEPKVARVLKDDAARVREAVLAQEDTRRTLPFV